MFWSNSMQLVNFSTTKVWPLSFFRKSICGKPGSEACHHVAYIPLVSPTCFPFAELSTPASWLHTGCHTSYVLTQPEKDHYDTLLLEAYAAWWKVVLDNDFKEAYAHGFVAECLDGRCRWFYPWILTYSADYPEKYVYHESHTSQSVHHFTYRILLARIWDKGLCPCPWCLIPKSDIHMWFWNYKCSCWTNTKARVLDWWEPAKFLWLCQRLTIFPTTRIPLQGPWWAGIKFLCHVGSGFVTQVWIRSLEGCIQTSYTSFICCGSSRMPTELDHQ